MADRLALVHTVGSLVPVFRDLARELVPGAETVDIVDEALLAETIAAGHVPDRTARRLAHHVDDAVREGADLVVVTCSSVGPAVEAIARRSAVPVLRIDEAMADAALRLGSRIGVIATLATTLQPTAELIRRRAASRAAGPASADGTAGALTRRPVEIVTHLVDGAFGELRSGRSERHDSLVRQALRSLLPRVEVVVLAQASMARVAAGLTEAETAGRPILSSPRLGMERVAERLGAGREAGRRTGGPTSSLPGPSATGPQAGRRSRS